MSEIHNAPSEVASEGGAVIVDGPDGVAVTMTPDGAAETSHRLLECAATAAAKAHTASADQADRRARHAPATS